MIFFSLGSSNGEQIFVNFSHDLKSWPPDIICNSKNLKKKVYIGTGEMYQFSYNPSDGKVDCKVKYTVSFKCLRICICIFLPGLPYLFEDHHLLRLPAGPLWHWQPRDDGQVRHHKLCLPWVTMTQLHIVYAMCSIFQVLQRVSKEHSLGAFSVDSFQCQWNLFEARSALHSVLQLNTK